MTAPSSSAIPEATCRACGMPSEPDGLRGCRVCGSTRGWRLPEPALPIPGEAIDGVLVVDVEAWRITIARDGLAYRLSRRDGEIVSWVAQRAQGSIWTCVTGTHWPTWREAMREVARASAPRTSQVDDLNHWARQLRRARGGVR